MKKKYYFAAKVSEIEADSLEQAANLAFKKIAESDYTIKLVSVSGALPKGN